MIGLGVGNARTLAAFFYTFEDEHPKHGRRRYDLLRAGEVLVLRRDNVELPAQPMELRMLELFLNHPNVPLDKSEIAASLWGHGGYLDKLLGELRDLLEDSRPWRLIQKASKGGLIFSGKIIQSVPVASDGPVPIDPAEDATASVLNGIPINWAAQIDAFRVYCRGTPTTPAPFGGRARELNELDRWLADSAAPRCGLIEAHAGLGKSTLLAHWINAIQQRSPQINLVYLPVSARFGTNSETAVFESIAFRLARVFGEPAPQGHDVRHFRNLTLNYLRRADTLSNPVLVIVDGLDEAGGWKAGPDLFPPNPASPARILVSARAFDDGGDSWLRRLAWETPGVARTFPLSALSRDGISEAVAHAGDSLAPLAEQHDVVEILLQKTKGDPLVVGLYIQEMQKRIQSQEGFDVTRFEKSEPGLRGFLRFWVEDQVKLWNSKRHELIPGVRTFLALCSVSYGPLAGEDFLGVAPGVFADRLTLDGTAEDLERLVIALDGSRTRRRYVLQHPRLADFIREELLDPDEVDQYSVRLRDYCKRSVAEFQGGGRKAVSEYVLRWTGVHLESCQSPAREFTPLMNAAWCREWERFDQTPAGFILDLDRIWRRSLAAESIGLAFRALLLRASVVTRNDLAAEDLVLREEELFRECLNEGLINPTLGEIIARQQEPETGCRFLLAISDLSNGPRPQLLSDALQLAGTDPQSLGEVARRLDPDHRSRVLADAERYIRQTGDAAWRWKSLAKFAEFLDGPQRERALQDALVGAAQTDDRGSFREQILCAIVDRLRPDDSALLSQTALLAKENVEVLTRLASKEDGERREIIAKTLRQLIVSSDDSLSSRASDLAELAVLFSAPTRDELLSEAWSMFRADEDEPDPHVLARIAVAFRDPPQELLKEALDAAFEAEYPIDTSYCLSTLSQLFVGSDRENCLSDALDAARDLPDDGNRQHALCTVVGQLGPEDHRLLGECRNIALRFRSKRDRARILIQLALRAAPHQKKEALREALSAAQSISDQSEAAEVLGILAQRLEGPDRQQIFEQGIEIAAAVRDPDRRTSVLEGIAKLIDPSESELLSAALHRMRWQKGPELSTKDGPWDCIRSLCAIAARLGSPQREIWLEEANSTAAAVTAGNRRALVLTYIAESLSPADRKPLLEEAIEAVEREDDTERAEILGSIVKLAVGSYDDVVLKARALAPLRRVPKDPAERLRALIPTAKAHAEIARYIDGLPREDELRAARKIARAVFGNPTRAEWLANLIGLPSDEEYAQTLQEAIDAAMGEGATCWEACEILLNKAGQARPDFVSQVLQAVMEYPYFNDEHFAGACAALAKQLNLDEYPSFVDYLIDSAINLNTIHEARAKYFGVAAQTTPIARCSRLVDKLRSIAYAAETKSIDFLRLRLGELIPFVIPRWGELCRYRGSTPLVELGLWLEPISHSSRADLLSSIAALAPAIELAGGKEPLRQIAQAIVDSQTWWP